MDFFYADYPSLRVSFEIVITDLDATDTDEDLDVILEQIEADCSIEEINFSSEVITIEYEIGSGALLETLPEYTSVPECPG